MTRTVHCIKLNKEAEGLDFPPYPGDLGKKIWESVSKEAWAAWLKHQTMYAPGSIWQRRWSGISSVRVPMRRSATYHLQLS